MPAFRKLISATTLLLAAILGSPANAEDVSLTVVLSGEAFDGPPAFRIEFAGIMIGQGTVDKAIDTKTQGRLDQKSDWTPYMESFTYTIPSAVFHSDGLLTIRLTNDHWGGPDTELDRNLVLISANLDGVKLVAPHFKLLSSGEMKEVPQDTKTLLLSNNSIVAIAEPPEGGWPMPKTKIQIVAKSGETSADAPAATPGGCTVTDTVAVVNFRSNRTAVPAGNTALDELAAALSGQVCAITITGYSSISGSAEYNEKLSQQRAQAVAEHLKDAGVDMSQVEISGKGGTEEFGDRYATNRRVVVTVAPPAQ